MHDLTMALYGTAEPPAAARLLRAGKLEASLERGNLRTICFNGIEILRGIYFLVRDTGWGTYAPWIEDISVVEEQGRFEVLYRARCEGAEGRFDYQAAIIGEADGSLSFAGEGASARDFPANRIGFVVLHPIAGVAGADIEVEHVDGARQTVRLPEFIAPAQPVMDIRSLAHQAEPGLRIHVRMEGDAFEMEDQRNWTDASFKTYVRPLAEPRPFVVAAGEVVRQSVRLWLTDQRSAASSSAARPGTSHVLALGKQLGRMPQFGLALDVPDAFEAMSHLPQLRQIKPNWLAVRLDDADTDLAPAAHFAKELAAKVLTEIIVAGKNPDSELRVAAQRLTAAGIAPRAVLACPARDMRSRPSGAAPADQADSANILAAARRHFPDALIGGGTLAFFTEFNRNPPPTALADFIAHGSAANVHAADDLSVMETLEAWPDVLASARYLCGPKPYWLGSVTIGMRENPYGTGPAQNPLRQRVPMARFDPRHFSLFGAAFALGVLAAAVRVGVDVITLAHTAGDFGLVKPRTEGGQPTPLFWLLNGLARVAGRTCLDISPQPGLAAVAVDHRGETEMWLANLCPRACDVALPAAGFTQLETLAAGADGVVAGMVIAMPSGALRLGPYALARLATAGAAGEASHV